MNAQINDAEILRRWIGSWQLSESGEKKQKLLEACKINKTRFNNLRRGIVKLTELEKEKINELAGIEIFKLTQN